MGYYYINDKRRNELTDRLLQIISSAKSYIKISSFLMEDHKVVSELSKVAESGRIAVFVISNRNNKESDEYKATTKRKDKTDSEGINTHQMFLQKLFYSGVHVRLLDNLHAKFIISDGKDGLLMSANIAPNSLSRNVETGISVEEKDLKDLELIFDTMYNYADIVQFVKSDRSDVVKKSIRKMPNHIFESLSGNIKLTATSKYDTNLSECRQTSLYDTIIKIIDNSKSFVYIVSWVFKDKQSKLYKLQKSINNALSRGVKISLFYNDNMSLINQSLQQRFIYDMGNKGCNAFTIENNHSKCIISEKEGLLFTANIDGNNGLLEGFEVGCIMDQHQHEQALIHIKEYNLI